MTEEFRPILLENLEIRIPGFRLSGLALNQHMPRVERLTPHHHAHHQVLIYLRGSGTQFVEDARHTVRRGVAVFRPAGAIHRFEKDTQRRPVCLVIDFGPEEASPWKPFFTLDAGQLAEIEQKLVDLHDWHHRRGAPSIPIASLLLQILAVVDAASSTTTDPASRSPLELKVEKVLHRIGLENIRPALVSREMGLSLDHLNRSLRKDSGKTVGQFISDTRLERARQLLRETDRPIHEVASLCGIDDQNYFARWFRSQTGHPPSDWRKMTKGRRFS